MPCSDALYVCACAATDGWMGGWNDGNNDDDDDDDERSYDCHHRRSTTHSAVFVFPSVFVFVRRWDR